MLSVRCQLSNIKIPYKRDFLVIADFVQNAWHCPTLALRLPSVLKRLTAEFGMGSGIPASLEAPSILNKMSFYLPLSQRGIKGDFENAPTKQESFIKPYSPISRPTLPLRQTSSSIQATPPQPRPASPQPSPLHIGGQAYKGERDRPVPQFRPAANIPDNFASQTGKEEINKYFNTHESPDIPAIKIHSITEHNEPKMAQQVPPKMNIQRPVPTLPPRQASSPQSETRPKYKIIDPFFSKPEPRIDGNIVDLSDK